MDVFEEICNKLANTSPKDITPHLRNAFINQVCDAIFHDKEKLKNKDFLTLQGVSRVYSFYQFPAITSVPIDGYTAGPIDAVIEAYNNGFLYGLTRLCEIAEAEENK